jgi:hypothetical protein
MKKQISILSGVIGLVGATTFSALTPVSAALTAPTTFDYSYTYQNDFFVANQDDDLLPIYTRTTDASYYNYTYSGNIDGNWPFDITMTFNRSNTNWISGSGGFAPFDTKIGSDGTVGSINKLSLSFNNQTNKNYSLFLDLSSTSAFINFMEYSINGFEIGRSDTNGFTMTFETLGRFYIPSYSTVNVYTSTNSTQLFLDAWYLQDLGISPSYQEGYDTGYDEGIDQGFADGFFDGYNEGYSDGSDFGYTEAILNNGIVDIISNVFDGMAGIFGISILGGITLGTLTLLPLLGMVLFFFKKFIQ